MQLYMGNTIEDMITTSLKIKYVRTLDFSYVMIHVFQMSFYVLRMHVEMRAVYFRQLVGHFMMTSSNGNIFRVTGHLCGEFTGSFDVFFDLRLNKQLSKQS